MFETWQFYTIVRFRPLPFPQVSRARKNIERLYLYLYIFGKFCTAHSGSAQRRCFVDNQDYLAVEPCVAIAAPNLPWPGRWDLFQRARDPS